MSKNAVSINYNFGWSNQVPVQILVLFEFELFLFLSAVKRFSALPVNDLFSREVQEVLHKKCNDFFSYKILTQWHQSLFRGIVHVLWKGHKNWTKFPKYILCPSYYTYGTYNRKDRVVDLSFSKYEKISSVIFCQIFVAFLENLNCTRISRLFLSCPSPETDRWTLKWEFCRRIWLQFGQA